MTKFDKKNLLVQEHNSYVEELLSIEAVKKLDDFTQHLNTSRLEHSVSVSYYSFLICKKFGWDCVSAARAGLLHDLYHYDWRLEKQPEGNHAYAHPLVALRNAKLVTELNRIESDAIVKHMWPLTLRFPRYKESYAVTLADKYCASMEFITQINKKISKVLKQSAI